MLLLFCGSGVVLIESLLYGSRILSPQTFSLRFAVGFLARHALRGLPLSNDEALRAYDGRLESRRFARPWVVVRTF